MENRAKYGHRLWLLVAVLAMCGSLFVLGRLAGAWLYGDTFPHVSVPEWGMLAGGFSALFVFVRSVRHV